MATIAAYGPNSTFASKLVVSVLERLRRDPVEMRTWTTVEADVRQDQTVAAEVAGFLREHGVKRSVSADRIIGCPHEEGVDYPMGRVCPRCPFWAGIDRFTHEPVVTPAPSMSPSEVLAALSRDGSTPPLEALEAADGHRDVLVEPLLSALDVGLTHATDATPEEAALFAYALYLLAKWRETRAYPSVIRWLSLPGEAAFDLAGDVVTQDGGRILASVCDGDLEPITALILNRRANEFGRAGGITALTLLAAWAEVPREVVIATLRGLAHDGLEREHSQVWDSLACDCADIEALEVFPEIRRAYADGLIDPLSVHPSELDKVEDEPRGHQLDKTRDRWPPIDDVAHATSWWARSSHEREFDSPEPYRAPPKIGRNDPCPCGSGKKFKKCCGA